MVLRSLSFFNDADIDPEISYIREEISWQEIKKSILEQVISF